SFLCSADILFLALMSFSVFLYSLSALILSLSVTCVSAERAGNSEFAQFMPNHVFCHVYRDKFVPVVYSDGVSNKIRRYHRGTCPCFDNSFLAALIHGVHLLF